MNPSYDFAGQVALVTGAVSALVGAFANGTQWPMELVVALCAIGGVLCTLPPRAAPKERTTRAW